MIGGAYSVDKYYRQAMGYRWFKDEQLSEEEMGRILEENKEKHFDIVLSHTCPYSWEPKDLFLKGLDQSTVDNSTELWLDKLKDRIDYNQWMFGHFHDNRIVRPHVEMFYTTIEKLDTIKNRWRTDRVVLNKKVDPKVLEKDNIWAFDRDRCFDR